MLNECEALVWRVDLDGDADQYPAVELAEETRERASRFQDAKARVRYLRSHAVLHAILRGLGLPAVIARTAGGRPRLVGIEGVDFSLSRSAGVALVAVASLTVGVDVERIRPLPDCLAVAEHFGPPEFYQSLLAVPPAAREREFFRLWTRLESVLKAAGVGLHGAGQSPVGEWTTQELDAGAGYAAAVSLAGSGGRVLMRDFA